MKKLLYFILILNLISCQKEEINLPENNDISAYHNEYGKFQKEITVTDQTGENSVFLMVHSDIPGAIEHYLNSVDLSLDISMKENELLKSASTSEHSMMGSNPEAKIPDEIYKRQVCVELITENIKENVVFYSIVVKPNEMKLKSDFIFASGAYCVAYRTTGDFVGISNYGTWSNEDKYDIYCYLEKKDHWYSLSWNTLWAGFLDGHVNDLHYYNYLNYTNYPDGSPWYKIGALVYTDQRVPLGNYLWTFEKENFRGHQCTIGSYDSRNCYVGTAPSGTTAFMWPNAQGAFYYSPVNGNQCPYPGSSFDGVNCYVIDIPSSCEGFVHNNKWYVKTNLIID